MISLSLAQKLKNAGLRWEPKMGDFFTTPGTNLIQCAITPIRNVEYATSKIVWLPRLDQLLAEIEKRGYEWSLHSSTSTYDIELYNSGDMYSCLIKSDDKPEDVAGQALLWILKQETGR